MQAVKSLLSTLRNFFVLLLTMMPLASFAQSVEMADQLRSSGKIYIVIIVIVTIFIGIIVYLFSLEKKLKRLEKGSK